MHSSDPQQTKPDSVTEECTLHEWKASFGNTKVRHRVCARSAGGQLSLIHFCTDPGKISADQPFVRFSPEELAAYGPLEICYHVTSQLQKHVRNAESIAPRIFKSLSELYPALCTNRREPLFSAVYNWPMNKLADAEHLPNTGIEYRVYPSLMPDHPEHAAEWQTLYHLPDGQTLLKNVHYHYELPQTEEVFRRSCDSMMSSEISSRLDDLPARIIHLDQEPDRIPSIMHASGDFRRIYLYRPEPGCGCCQVYLRVFSFYNGSPYEGGGMAGFTFSRLIAAPEEVYTWLDSYVIAEYGSLFPRK